MTCCWALQLGSQDGINIKISSPCSLEYELTAQKLHWYVGIQWFIWLIPLFCVLQDKESFVGAVLKTSALSPVLPAKKRYLVLSPLTNFFQVPEEGKLTWKMYQGIVLISLVLTMACFEPDVLHLFTNPSLHFTNNTVQEKYCTWFIYYLVDLCEHRDVMR